MSEAIHSHALTGAIKVGLGKIQALLNIRASRVFSKKVRELDSCVFVVDRSAHYHADHKETWDAEREAFTTGRLMGRANRDSFARLVCAKVDQNTSDRKPEHLVYFVGTSEAFLLSELEDFFKTWENETIAQKVISE